jgi:lysophospholipase L1-like esterase
MRPFTASRPTVAFVAAGRRGRVREQASPGIRTSDDHLHPDDAGHQAMAATVRLAQPRCQR